MRIHALKHQRAWRICKAIAATAVAVGLICLIASLILGTFRVPEVLQCVLG